MKFDSKVIAYAGWEMFFMRALFAWEVWKSIPVFLPYTSQPHPNGLGVLLDLTFLSSPEAMGPLRGLLAVALVFYAIRIFSVPALAVAFTLQVACGSLENSQGAINHSLQPLSLVTLGQLIVAAYGLVRNFRGSGAFFDSLETQRLGVHAAKVALVSCYVASAITKLIESEGGWVFRATNLASQIIKSNANYYLNALENPGPMAAAAPEFIVQHPVISTIFISGGLFLELSAFLALLGRWQGAVFGMCMIFMHAMIQQVMRLEFPTFQHLCLIFLINVPFLVCAGGKQFLRVVRRSRAA